MARVCLVNIGSYAALDGTVQGAYIGGEELQHALLARMLNRRGVHECSVVTARYGPDDGTLVEGIRVYGAYDPAAGLPLVRYVHPRWTGLVRAMRRADADVYYVSCAAGNTGHVLTWARVMGRASLFRIASDGDCIPARMLISGRAARAWFEFGLGCADVISAQSEHQRQLLKANYGLDAAIAPLVHEDPGRPLALGERDIDVLWVANLWPWKRPELFVEIARALPRLRFHLVGGPAPGHESLAEQLRAAACAASNLTLHGRLGYHETAALFTRSRLFVNTSIIEGFPNTFIQAWSHGAPVVSFHDPDGIIARHGLGHAATSATDMAAAVGTLLGNDAAWHSASDRCRAHVRTRYDPDSTLAIYEAHVDQALERARRAGRWGTPDRIGGARR